MTSLGAHEISNRTIDHVRLNMVGSFKAFRQWLQLLRQVKGVLMTDFSFAAQKDANILFIVDLWLWQEGEALSNHFFTQRFIVDEHEPFCLNSNQLLNIHSPNLQEIKLNQIKMLGVIDDQGEKTALIELAGGELVKIKKGMKLGAADAEIMQIYDNYLEMSLPNNQKIRLQRQGISP